jgi:phospholipase/carboxylesterase
MSRPVIVALHGVGSNARDMAQALAPLEQYAQIVALDGSEPFGAASRGRQWLSVAGITEANRPGRVREALPSLLLRLDAMASDRGVARDELVLLGFSQGAIMTLALAAQGLHQGRAIAIAGRLAAPMISGQDRAAPILLIDDAADRIMPTCLSDEAAAVLAGAGRPVDRIHTSGVGHSIGPATITAIATWLAATAPSQPDTLIKG